MLRSYDEVGNYFSQLYRLAKNNVHGVPLNLYFENGYIETSEIEVCVPVKKELKGDKDINYKVLPKVIGLSVMHIGKYETIGNAYKALIDFSANNKLELGVPSRCIYIKGPGMLFKEMRINILLKCLCR